MHIYFKRTLNERREIRVIVTFIMTIQRDCQHQFMDGRAVILSYSNNVFKISSFSGYRTQIVHCTMVRHPLPFFFVFVFSRYILFNERFFNSDTSKHKKIIVFQIFAIRFGILYICRNCDELESRFTTKYVGIDTCLAFMFPRYFIFLKLLENISIAVFPNFFHSPHRMTFFLVSIHFQIDLQYYR